MVLTQILKSRVGWNLPEDSLPLLRRDPFQSAPQKITLGRRMQFFQPKVDLRFWKLRCPRRSFDVLSTLVGRFAFNVVTVWRNS
jgi:hypothetical protein